VAELLLAAVFAGAEERARPHVSVAAAANLVHAISALNAEFKRLHAEVAVTSATGSSGSLFAQVKNGAPFDVVLSADTEYPEQMVAAGLGLGDTLHVFATGRLVAWTTRVDLELSDLGRALRSPLVRKIAIAQPRTAPYGRAAEAALEHLGGWPQVQPKLVFGESIAQAAQFVETGNADLGLIALSLVLSPTLSKRGRWMEVPPAWYATVSLDHAMILTNRGAKNSAARSYHAFLRSAAAKKILRDFGYGVPP
jgi:molybdate transport system substrate-binding protein